MEPELEAALKTWVVAENVAPVGNVFTGFTGDEQPTNDQTLTILARATDRRASVLYRVTCDFIIATPPHDGGSPATALPAHQTLVAAVRTLLETPPASLKTTIDTDTDLFSRGSWMMEGGEQAIDGGRWVTIIPFLLGISTTAAS